MTDAWKLATDGNYWPAGYLPPAGSCCDLHNPQECCDPEDCGPCCENCPTCPVLARERDRAKA